MTATAGLKYYAMLPFETPPNYAFMAIALQIYMTHVQHCNANVLY